MKIPHSLCTGCEACSNRCPISCIKMFFDSEGFRYPNINKDKCLNCGLCEKVCPVLKRENNESKTLTFNLAINKDEKIRIDSSSGGIFHLLAENIISKGGSVYAVKYDKDFNVIHSKIESIKDIDEYRNSKYVQSHIGWAYKNIEADLKSNLTVLFVGTPCQVAGLKSFLRRDYENLVTVDFICHGVPSVKAFQSYLNFINIKDKLSFKINMRDKSEGWNGYGVKISNGNNSISDGAALGLMSSANYPLGTTLYNGYASLSLDIPDLTWEKVYSWNWGIDIGMWHNRLTIAADYYRKTTKDLLYEITVPGVMGFSTIWDNIGEVFNEGVELELNTVNLVKPFKWTTSFNLSYNRNEIVNLGENETVFINDNTQVLMVGEPLRSFYMYDAVGVYQYTEDLYKYPVRKGTQLGDVRYRDANDDGVIDDSDRTLVGKPDPDFIFGLTNNFSYKNWDLSVVLTAQTGGYLYSISPGRYIDNPGMGYSQNLFSWWQNCWWSEEEPGDGKTPAIDSTTGELRDTRWLYKSDYLRIKNITLGYRLPLSKKSRYVKGARFYLAVENVWRWDSYPGGYSPENKGNNYYPQARTYSLGASLNF